MTIAYVAAAIPTPFTAVGSVSAASPAGALGTLIVFVLAFEGVAAGSGPWVDPNTGQFPSNVVGPSEGWLQACFQAPSATGVGLEVWVALEGTSPPIARVFEFNASSSGSIVAARWSGIYTAAGISGTLRGTTKQQWTGNTPQSPAITTPQSGDLVIPVGAMEMTTPGFGTPTGSGNEGAYVNRTDAARSGFGTAEAVIGDAQVLITGTTGAITWPGNAASGTTHGAMATLDVRPAPVVPTSAGLALDFTYPLT